MTRGVLILASASPRRADLLTQAGVPFVIEPSQAPEELSGFVSVEDAACSLAQLKALVVAKRHPGEHGWVLGADTIVAVGEGASLRMLGKPEGPDEAREMLMSLADTRHQVVTGLAVVDLASAQTIRAYERTWVQMGPISNEDVLAYVSSGEWRGKAGGYAIQETADRYVSSLSGGGMDNVIGLPVSLTLQTLRGAGWPG